MTPDGSGNTEPVEAKIQGLRSAASRFFSGEHRLLEAPGIPMGYSGSVFARVETPAGSWFLRRWPPDLGVGRLRFVHRALAESRSRDFSGVPALAATANGDTVLRLSGRLYDAQGFLGGEPLAAQGSTYGGPAPNVACGAPLERLAALARALARFHLSTSGLSPRPGERAAPLPERLRSLEEGARARSEPLWRAARARGTSEGRAARPWLALLPPALEAARRAVDRLPPGGTSEVLCHADIWPGHVRFEGDSFAGFADFESLAFASPALDLAQLVGHFGGWRTADTVLRSYGASAPLKEGDVASLAPEAVADLAAEGLWALEALYGRPEGASPAQEAAHRLNLRLLLNPLKAASISCERLAP